MRFRPRRAFIYIRGEYYFAYTRLVEAIEEAKAKGYLGKKIFGTGKNLEIVVHRGAGAYECGEETALLTSLEGYRGHPRMKPPFPAVEGLYAKPTIVNNVESICNVTHVMRHGVDWYQRLRHRKKPWHAHLLPQRQCEAPGPLRIAPRRAAAAS